MSYETIGDSFKAQLDKVEDYHYTLLAGNTIWVISQTFVDQKSFNWGHRVAIAGGYAIGFDLTEKKWGEKKTFAPLYEDENSTESLFVMNDEVHLLVASSFNELHFIKLLKWTGEDWQQVAIAKNSEPEANDNPNPTSFIVAESSTPGVTFLVNNRSWRVYRLTVANDSADIEFVSDITYEGYDRNMGCPTSAFYNNGKLYISYGVTGCGFMWKTNGLFVYHEADNKVEQVSVGNGEYPDGPSFDSGAQATGHSSKGEWIHAGGSIRSGMCGSENYPKVFALTENGSELTWTNLGRDIPEGTAVIDSKKDIIYSVGEKVSAASLY